MPPVQGAHGPNPVEDQDPFQVIEFMLDRARFEPFCPQLRILSLDHDSFRASNVSGDVGQAEATLAGDVVPLALRYERVHEHQQSAAGRCEPMPSDIHYRDAVGFPDLRSGQADAARMCAHGIDKVGGDSIGRGPADVDANPLEERVWEDENGPDHRRRRFDGATTAGILRPT
jgi:hypothetical protein